MTFDSQHPKASAEEGLDAWLALTGQIPVPDQPVALPMLSGSMNPAIPVGAKLQILVQKETECQVGDVVVFLDGEKKLTAHRILLVLRLGHWQYVLEKGDANPLGRWRHAKDIRGRVLGFEGHKQTHSDPSDDIQASRSLRAHFRHWVKTCGGRRKPQPKSNEKPS